MTGFPEHVIESAWGPDALAHLRREAEQKRHEADLARADGGVEAAEVLEQEAAELDTRVDSLSPHWPIRPFEVSP